MPEVINIYTRKDLELFRDTVCNSTRGIDTESYDVHLRSDIDLSGIEDWETIGESLKPFCGSFDGHGHTVSGLHISGSHRTVLGLFGFVSDAVIKNLTVEGEVSGYSLIGGIVGEMLNSEIINCTNRVKCSGLYDVGGICGYAINGNIESCRNLASVEGWQAGGILGHTDVRYIIKDHKVLSAAVNNCRNDGELNVLGLRFNYIESDLGGIQDNNYRYGEIGGVVQKNRDNRSNGKVTYPFQNSFLGMVLENYDFSEGVREVTQQRILEFIEHDPNPEHVNEFGETYLHQILKNSHHVKLKKPTSPDINIVKEIILMLAEKTRIDFGATNKVGQQAEDLLKDPTTGRTYRGYASVVKLIQAVKNDKDRLGQEQEEETFSDIGF